MVYAKTKLATNKKNIPISLSSTVYGEISPYPIVLIVLTAQYIE